MGPFLYVWTKPGSRLTFVLQVLDVTSFLSEHPGGELAILTFAGKDATEEFNMCLGKEYLNWLWHVIMYMLL